MTKTTVKDEWVREAMTDDYVVVELLVRLKQAQDASPPPKSVVAALRWGMRQPRSRPMLMRCDAKIDGGDFNVGSRGSPTTPLSWSGGGGAASPLAADGFEETCSSHVRGSPPAAPSRSKGTAANEATSTSTKRSGKKKTFAQLKEEENRLLEESVYLKKEIASMRATCKQHRARNANLKRFKLDTKASSSNVDEEEKTGSCVDYSPSTLPLHVVDDRKPMLDLRKGSCSEESLFLLPDLNMMPCEDA
ncbi:hypothetical protein like AT4G32030 [Hibiscus trionum]|uniref:BZIP domain-containing protein n=1 Tax=Hibiscus trionum TaxID=183268 RepID=A0A9W7I4N8_HIBTR|nr:hypothetical protein like AT4G32030 [Hibiscus trionum]